VVSRPTYSPPVEEHREFPLELVLLLCNQGKFSEAEELTARWVARAEDELRENGCYIVLVSRAIVDELRDNWSPLVQLTASSEGGIAELTVREVQSQEDSQ
jgi:hypothetical protein